METERRKNLFLRQPEVGTCLGRGVVLGWLEDNNCLDATFKPHPVNPLEDPDLTRGEAPQCSKGYDA